MCSIYVNIKPVYRKLTNIILTKINIKNQVLFALKMSICGLGK